MHDKEVIATIMKLQFSRHKAFSHKFNELQNDTKIEIILSNEAGEVEHESDKKYFLIFLCTFTSYHHFVETIELFESIK